MHVNDTMSAQDVAQYLGIGKNAVYKFAKEGVIASYRIGRRLLFSRADVDAYLQAQRIDSAPLAVSMNPYERDSNGVDLARSGDTALIVAGRDRAGDVIARFLSDRDVVVERSYRNCLASLADLYTGNADAAIVNLYDIESDSYNVAFVKRLMPGIPAVVYRLFTRDIGFLVAKGNPKGITDWQSLAQERVRFVSHKKGTGQRVLADQKLSQLGISPIDMEGRGRTAEATREAAMFVGEGAFDASLGYQHNADRRNDVEFVPLHREHVDIVFLREPRVLPAISAFEDAVADASFEAALDSDDGRDCSALGQIVYEQ